MAAPQVTDRAHRYRAQKLAPGGRKACAYCGGTRNLVVDHKDGVPDHTVRSNLQWACKSCNTKKGAAFAKAGRGRLTHQYNPASGEVPTLKQYAWGVSNHTRGANDEGGAIIHATPPKVRSEYARAMAGAARRTKRERFDERYNPWPFSRPDARRTTAASARSFSLLPGAKSRPAPKAAAVKSSGSYKGYAISRTPEGEYFSSLDPSSWFETKRGAQALIDSHLKGRSNPSDGAASAYERFHGTPSREVVEVTEERHVHEHLSALGDLKKIKLRAPDGGIATLLFRKGALLCQNEEGTQLFIRGGDQSVDLEAYGIDEPWHEVEDLGEVLEVRYFTTKKHLGRDGGTAVYFHHLGEEDKGRRPRRPRLVYNRRDELLSFAGGGYTIPSEGIRN